MVFQRRQILLGGAAFLASCGGDNGGNVIVTPPNPPSSHSQAVLNEILKKTFDFFWETTDHKTGLTPDRWPTHSFCSIAGVGFALGAYPIGVKNGFITREQARERTLNTLRHFWGLKQGPEARGNAGYKGFYYHFLNFETGERIGECELSTIDTALLMSGVLFAAEYFNSDHKDEAEIREIAQKMYDRIEWDWSLNNQDVISMGWKPESGFIKSNWEGYSEGMILYILAIASNTHPIPSKSWEAWTRTYPHSWGSYGGYEHLIFPPHFGHQFSHTWVDFRGIFDAYMKAKGFDYFENSRRATYAQRQYAINNPKNWRGYSKDIWGVSACDGPMDIKLEYKGEIRQFISYAGRGAGLFGENVNTFDDGTITPMAAVASIPYAPEISTEALVAMYNDFGQNIVGQYGFYDSFNLSFDFDVKPQHGKIIKGFGWVDTDYLAIDQGPIITAIENHRSDFIWKYMRKNPIILRGLEMAGFSGGYLA